MPASPSGPCTLGCPIGPAGPGGPPCPIGPTTLSPSGPSRPGPSVVSGPRSSSLEGRQQRGAQDLCFRLRPWVLAPRPFRGGRASRADQSFRA
eukprot:127225-Rhodomonas_salina.1